MRKNLSSYRTFILQIGTPVFIILLLIEVVFQAKRDGWPAETFLFLGILTLFFGVSLRLAWQICFVSTDDKALYIWSPRGSDVIPLQNLKEINAISRSHSPHIDLSFEPPSKLGAQISIMLGAGFSKKRYWEVYEYLSEYAAKANHDEDIGADPAQSSYKRGKFIFVVWLVMVLAIVGLFLMA